MAASSASVLFGKNCFAAFLTFFIAYFVFALVKITAVSDAVLMILYTASLYAVGDMLDITVAVFFGLSSFVSSLFGKKGILRASSIIGGLSFVFLVLCLVFRENPSGEYGTVRFIIPVLASAACAYCTEYGYFARIIPMLSGFGVGVIFNICGGIFAEIFIYASLFCSFSLALSSAEVFKKSEDGEYNKNG